MSWLVSWPRKKLTKNFSCRCKSCNGSLNKASLAEGVRRRHPTASRNSGSLFTAWGNALALRRVVGAGTPWHTWKAPEGWIWVLIGSGLLGVVAPDTWGTAALNLFLVMAAVYFLQGLAIVQNLFEVRSFPRMFRVAAYILLFVQLPVMMLVAGVGAFDLWFDFRSRWVPHDDDAGAPED